MNSPGRLWIRPVLGATGLVWLLVLASGCAHTPTTQPDAASPTAQIQAVLRDQVVDWNSGDLAGFMDGYARSDTTRFVSGGTVTEGWQTVFDRYRSRYTDAAAMGRVTFSDVKIETFSAEVGFVSGAWRLDRGGDSPSGRFTLLLRRFPEGWRIVYDHTSAAEN